MTFRIVTLTTIYAEGETHLEAFDGLGADAPRLESYEHDGDYLTLHYTDGCNLLIPEHQVRYIAYRDQS